MDIWRHRQRRYSFECGRAADEFTAIAEKWGYWSDGTGDLLPFCPECAKREFVAAVETEAKPRTQ